MNPDDCGVYSLTNVLNGHRYIGSSVALRRRVHEHWYNLGRGRHHSQHLQAAFNLYRADAFRLDILLLCDPELCVAMEQRFIDLLKPEYNVLPRAGTSLGRIMSASARARISAAKKGHAVSAVTRAAIAASNRRRQISAETQRKMQAARIGKKRQPLTASHRANISIGRLGLRPTDSTRAKISEALRGRKRGPPSESTRAQLSRSMSGREFSSIHRSRIDERITHDPRTGRFISKVVDAGKLDDL